MKNVLTTIPKAKYSNWAECEWDLKRSDGSELGGFWLVNTTHLPKDDCIGALCFMVYDGLVRGYMDIVNTADTEACRSFHRIGKRRTTKSMIMANWHPITPVPQVGFQGWRYTQLRP